MTTDYQKQATDFLEAHSITFKAEFIGSDCPKWCEDAAKGVNMDKVSSFPRKTHIHGKHYRCTFERRVKVSEADGKPIYSSFDRGPMLTVDFWNSYADEEFNALGCKKYRDGEITIKYGREMRDGKFQNVRPKSPTPYDVLSCIEKNEVGTFEEFCSDFGYDTDSRKAEAIYHEVQTQVAKVRRFFTKAELEELQEIQ